MAQHLANAEPTRVRRSPGQSPLLAAKALDKMSSSHNEPEVSEAPNPTRSSSPRKIAAPETRSNLVTPVRSTHNARITRSSTGKVFQVQSLFAWEQQGVIPAQEKATLREIKHQRGLIEAESRGSANLLVAKSKQDNSPPSTLSPLLLEAGHSPSAPALSLTVRAKQLIGVSEPRDQAYSADLREDSLRADTLQQEDSHVMASSRPRTGRGLTGRDANKDNDLEAEIHAQVIEGMKAAKAHNDRAREAGLQIIALQDEIRTRGGRPTKAEQDRLDKLLRENIKASEEENKVLKEEPHNLINRMAILHSLRSQDEPPQVRNGPGPKARNPKIRSSDLAEVVADSPGPSPGDPRTDQLKRFKGANTQRSSSVASSARTGGASARSEDGMEVLKGTHAERAGQFIIGAEVFYRHPKGALNVEGEGIQCIIKKVWLDKKPIGYDVQDPEPDESGRQDMHKATATDLIPIPQTGSHLPNFAVGRHVLARYPDTTTFYRAEVMSIRKDVYKLKFEGEEDDKEMEVDKRFVLLEWKNK